jgi:hypothetical protein
MFEVFFWFTFNFKYNRFLSLIIRKEKRNRMSLSNLRKKRIHNEGF